MDRIKRLSYEVMEQHKSKFTENFADNKKLLGNLAIIRSKGLKNRIAGYITKFIKKENLEQEINQSKEDSLTNESVPSEDTLEIDTNSAIESEEKVIEIGDESIDVSEIPEPTEDKTQ